MNKRQQKAGTPRSPITRCDNQVDATDLPLLRKQITETVSFAAMEMLQNAISAANEGNYVAMKYLFELIGLYPVVATEEPERDETLAAVLIERLGLTGDGAKSENTVE